MIRSSILRQAAIFQSMCFVVLGWQVNARASSDDIIFRKSLGANQELVVVASPNTPVEAYPLFAAAFARQNAAPAPEAMLLSSVRFELRSKNHPPLVLLTTIQTVLATAPRDKPLKVLDVLVEPEQLVVVAAAWGLELWRIPLGADRPEQWTLQAWSPSARFSAARKENLTATISKTAAGTIEIHTTAKSAREAKHAVYEQEDGQWKFRQGSVRVERIDVTPNTTPDDH